MWFIELFQQLALAIQMSHDSGATWAWIPVMFKRALEK